MLKRSVKLKNSDHESQCEDMQNVDNLEKEVGKGRQHEHEKSREVRNEKAAENHSCGKGKVKGLCRQQAGDLVNIYLSCKQCQNCKRQVP